MKTKGTDYDKTFMASHSLYIFNLYNVSRRIIFVGTMLNIMMRNHTIQNSTWIDYLNISTDTHTAHIQW